MTKRSSSTFKNFSRSNQLRPRAGSSFKPDLTILSNGYNDDLTSQLFKSLNKSLQQTYEKESNGKHLDPFHITVKNYIREFSDVA